MREYDPYSYEFHEDPYPVYKGLRDEAPLYRNERLDFYALSRHGDVLAGFKDHHRLSSRSGVALERPFGREAAETMSFLAMDPPRHTRMRALVSRAFTPRRVAELEPRIRAIAVEHLEAFLDRGRCDFIADFAGKLPMDVISEMLGVPPADRATLRDWADTVLHREEGVAEIPKAGMEAAMHLLQYFAAMLRRRKQEPGDDLTGALLRAEIDGDRLSDREIMGFLFLMIIAGNETTTKLLGNALYWIWKNPDQRRLVRDNPGWIPAWVEETLRYDASSQMLAREATEDLTYYGQRVPAGSRVLLLIGSANRDERVFTEPDRYDIRRDNTQAIPFGFGIHFCLGASLARLEGVACLQEIDKRIDDFGFDPQGLARVHSSNVRGFMSMPMEFRRRH